MKLQEVQLCDLTTLLPAHSRCRRSLATPGEHLPGLEQLLWQLQHVCPSWLDHSKQILIGMQVWILLDGC